MFLFDLLIVFATSDKEKLLNDANEYRKVHNKNILKENNKLNYVASDIVNFACTMGVSDVNSIDLNDLLRKNKYGDIKSFAINLSVIKENNVSKVMQDWKNNHTKNNNLLGEYDDTGLAICQKNDKNVYYVQVYVKKNEY